MDNYFSQLNSINVNGKTEKKNGLTYLSWAFAWGEVKKLFPDATYAIYDNKDGWNYHTDGRTCWVKTGVTINGIEHIEELPVMDHRNRSIALDSVTSFDVNKAIQRSLTKAVARHGLGLYIYAGEDLPEGEADSTPAQPATTNTQTMRVDLSCEDCGKTIFPYYDVNGRKVSAERHASGAYKKFGRYICLDCVKKIEAENG